MNNFIRQIVSDDGSLKSLFDHLRNVGISAVVFGAAEWRYRHADDGTGFYFNLLISAVLMVFGSFLFFLNQQHGLKKLRDAGYPKWVHILVNFTYAVVTINILFSLIPEK